MKKYKHKINGSIAEFVFTKSLTKDGFYSVKHKEGFTHIPIEFIENSNDWEEIKEEKKISNLNVKEEPNYLITAFKNNISGCIFKHDTQLKDMYCLIDGKKPFYDKADLLTNQSTVIYSVKNSKGEEFTIGDLVICEKEKFTISHFDIGYTNINIIMAVFNQTNTKLNNLSGSNIELISKSPIYTTTDGVDIYEGDRVWLSLLNKDLIPTVKDSVLIGNFCLQDKEVADRFLTFTSEENRDKYIKENSKKPVFVSADGKDMYEGYRYYVPQIDSRDKLTGTYLEFTTDTRTVSHGPKKFSTKSAAQEYIDNNKPRFSLADIEKSYYLAESSGIGEMIKELKKLAK